VQCGESKVVKFTALDARGQPARLSEDMIKNVSTTLFFSFFSFARLSSNHFSFSCYVMWVHLAMTNKGALLAIIMNPCSSLHIGLVGLMCLSESISRTLLVLFRCSTLHFIFFSSFYGPGCPSKMHSFRGPKYILESYHWNVSSSITQLSLNHVVSTSFPKHAAGSGHST
jgi:hypothetical protein